MRLEETLGLSYQLKIAEHLMRQKIDEILAPLGLSHAQYTVLSCLESEIQLTNAGLARKCSVTPQTMIRLLKNLERDGFVKKSAQADHGLKIDLKLSAKGLKTVCKAHMSVDKVERKVASTLKVKDQKALMESLKLCIESLKK
jgi:DNA-binding MarR family transcriptional regulator